MYGYAGYGTGFDSRGTFTHPSGEIGVNVTVFGVDMSSSVHATNRAKSILILGRSLTQDHLHFITLRITLYRKKAFC